MSDRDRKHRHSEERDGGEKRSRVEDDHDGRRSHRVDHADRRDGDKYDERRDVRGSPRRAKDYRRGGHDGRYRSDVDRSRNRDYDRDTRRTFHRDDRVRPDDDRRVRGRGAIRYRPPERANERPRGDRNADFLRREATTRTSLGAGDMEQDPAHVPKATWYFDHDSRAGDGADDSRGGRDREWDRGKGLREERPSFGGPAASFGGRGGRGGYRFSYPGGWGRGGGFGRGGGGRGQGWPTRRLDADREWAHDMFEAQEGPDAAKKENDDKWGGREEQDGDDAGWDVAPEPKETKQASVTEWLDSQTDETDEHGGEAPGEDGASASAGSDREQGVGDEEKGDGPAQDGPDDAEDGSSSPQPDKEAPSDEK